MVAAQSLEVDAISGATRSSYVIRKAVENPASGRVIEKLGFQFEKEIAYICNGGNIRTTGRFYRLVIKYNSLDLQQMKNT